MNLLQPTELFIVTVGCVCMAEGIGATIRHALEKIYN